VAVAEPERVRALFTAPAGHPGHVVSDHDPARLLDKLRAADQGGDVHLVGGPRTIETFRALGALDTLELIVLPLLFEAGMRLTDSLSPDTGLTFERELALPAGLVEIVYACQGQRSASWQTRQPAPEPLTRTAHLHPLAHGHDRAFRSRVDPARGTQIVPFRTRRRKPCQRPDHRP